MRFFLSFLRFSFCVFPFAFVVVVVVVVVVFVVHFLCFCVVFLMPLCCLVGSAIVAFLRLLIILERETCASFDPLWE